ncbi:spermidine hydroxycinnamoyl transferase [Trifolium repens]|jgi:hypothetical protein|nr:spermidine hydroxycinnamoyl transferase [Trifolium repens]
MATIKACYTVIPNESTPKGRCWLSDLDQVVRLSHTPLIYIYKPKKQNQKNRIIETIKNSLGKILVHYYPIAGRYCYKEGGRLELNLNAKGVVLIEAETTKTIHDYGDFSPSDSTKELIPKIDYEINLNDNQPSVLKFTAEIRNRIIPNLPKNYYGNALIQTSTRGYIGEIKSKPLSYIAMKIREAHELITNEYIRSQIDVIRSFENLDDARKLFIGGEGKNATYFGNPNLHITSWMALPAYKLDFGWGKPFYFGLGYVSPHDRGIIYLNPNGDDSVIVCMHFQFALMQIFKKFFYEDINELFTSAKL